MDDGYKKRTRKTRTDEITVGSGLANTRENMCIEKDRGRYNNEKNDDVCEWTPTYGNTKTERNMTEVQREET